MPRVLKFEADWCGPCKAIAVPLQQAAQEANINVESVDVESDEGQQVSRNYRINALPTLVLVDDEGIELNRMSGVRTRSQLDAFLQA